MSKYFRISPIEIEERWSIDDVENAHEALDYVEYMEHLNYRAMRKK
jgi:hypothetical protein